ncbi:Non-heme bromoperoxidase BPO-A2 [Burkholderia multivorans]|nr:alpha/beta fold hydrolase [Burkholderia multivorans]MDR9177759.1 Non-heme bromoperoxidase BPO-A2 [Burkholderia multivorans]MDR9182529.1 Non-heme bromoperoxidase BPO-A2 [Burkholderia multivorans]MDR9187854.1 Non-heme bromoperoxidase BPO-A2 [Burkholderia multivorans]MDR9193477.1 Non-heme bromoperoxidase BPO-A2 [Burkholderia multivorans]
MKNAMTTRTHAAGPTGIRHTWTSADGLRLAGRSWGDRDGAPVVLLHGSGQTRHAWSGMGRLLGAAGFYAVAFDARGHGESDWSPTCNYSQGAMIRDLERVAAMFDGRRPILVGAGLGGGTSLLAVGEGYVDAAALVLVNIAPCVEPAGALRLQSFMRQQPDGFGSLAEAADAIRRYRAHPPQALSEESLARSLRYDDGKYRWHWDPHFLAWPRDLTRRHARFAASARRLRLPTLLVRGADSDIVSEAGAREFLSLCPHAEHTAVRNAGHTGAGEHNDLFGQTVLDFLERRMPRERALRHRAAA